MPTGRSINPLTFFKYTLVVSKCSRELKPSHLLSGVSPSKNFNTSGLKITSSSDRVPLNDGRIPPSSLPYADIRKGPKAGTDPPFSFLELIRISRIRSFPVNSISSMSCITLFSVKRTRSKVPSPSSESNNNHVQDDGIVNRSWCKCGIVNVGVPSLVVIV